MERELAQETRSSAILPTRNPSSIDHSHDSDLHPLTPCSLLDTNVSEVPTASIFWVENGACSSKALLSTKLHGVSFQKN
jgi:hypothetical protein